MITFDISKKFFRELEEDFKEIGKTAKNKWGPKYLHKLKDNEIPNGAILDEFYHHPSTNNTYFVSISKCNSTEFEVYPLFTLKCGGKPLWIATRKKSIFIKTP